MATQVEYGLGFSPISFSNMQSFAFNEEMGAQKDVGIFGLVEQSGTNKYIISADYLAKQKYQLQNFVNLLVQTNNLGKIYRLKIDEYPGRAISASTSNMLNGSTVTISNGTVRTNALRFNFDIDISTKADCGLIHFNDATVAIDYTLTVGSKTVAAPTITDTLFGINKNKFTVDYSGFTSATSTDTVSLTISSIKITLGSSFDPAVDRISMFDILIAAL